MTAAVDPAGIGSRSWQASKHSHGVLASWSPSSAKVVVGWRQARERCGALTSWRVGHYFRCGRGSTVGGQYCPLPIAGPNTQLRRERRPGLTRGVGGTGGWRGHITLHPQVRLLLHG